MRFNYLKASLKKAILVTTVLLLGMGASFAQSVNLTAAATTTTLPDGTLVHMWGYSCNDAGTAPATCAALNPTAATAGAWSPVVITVPPGPLTISLTNNLPASVPETSLIIVGQLGGGLGTTASSTPSPAHGAQSVTWPIVDPTTQNVPPPQGNRVVSFSTPVAPTATGTLSWTALKPGTYLIESGTDPSIQGPMGLYGILVVTTAPSGTTPGTAYPAVTMDLRARLGRPTAVRRRRQFRRAAAIPVISVQAKTTAANFRCNAMSITTAAIIACRRPPRRPLRWPMAVGRAAAARLIVAAQAPAPTWCARKRQRPRARPIPTLGSPTTRAPGTGASSIAAIQVARTPPTIMTPTPLRRIQPNQQRCMRPSNTAPARKR